VIERIAYLAAIGAILVGFGALIALPDVSPESRGAAAAGAVAALVLIARASRRRPG
jgi:hypothetical protein